ncbi:MAG: TMEM143 family protein [Rhodomicrobium sp.]
MKERSAADAAALLSFRALEQTETGVDTVAQPIASTNPEKFIPVDRSDIVQRVLDKCFEPDQKELAEEVVRYMCALRQVESARLLDSLVEAYDAFNPDDETINDRVIVGHERRSQLEKLKAMVVDLVVSANYLEIDQPTLEKILEEENYAGFAAEVDLREYDFHLLYYRGEIKDKIAVRPWKTLWLRKRQVEVDAYRRLFIGLKLKPIAQRVAEMMKANGISRKKAEKLVRRARSQQMLEGVSENTLHLKVFRRIARTDLEILFPNAKIRFTPFDKLWLWVGSGGSTLFAIVMAVLKFVAAVAISMFFVVFTIAGAVGAIIRAVTNFFNTRTRYMAKLAKSLYFHNIASNQSVLTLLTDDAEEEDIKEAVITYALLLRHGHRGLEEVKYEAERFLHDEFGVRCDFDIEDGCVHLRGLGLLILDDAGSPRIRDLEDAREHLIESWQLAPSMA